MSQQTWALAAALAADQHGPPLGRPITDRRITIAAIARSLRQANRRGRRNISDLDAVLDARCPGEAAPRSLAESALDELLAQTDLPAPSCEYPLPGGPPGTQFVDRAWAQVRLILEVDGRTWHSRERDMAKDRARDRAAARLGWQTIRVLAQEVFSLPDLVRDDVVAIHEARRLELLRP